MSLMRLSSRLKFPFFTDGEIEIDTFYESIDLVLRAHYSHFSIDMETGLNYPTLYRGGYCMSYNFELE